MIKRRIVSILALCIAMTVLCSGCAGILWQLAEPLLGTDEVVAFKSMEYTRPDVRSLETALANAQAVAAEEENPKRVMDAVYDFYEVYDRFYTDYALANIHYSIDMTDIYWYGEYQFCLEQISVADAALDELYYSLAESPVREELESEEYFGADFFDAYEGESIWDETFMAMVDQENQLLNEYYSVTTQALETEYYSEEYFEVYGSQMAEIFVELIALRQQIAAYAGYDSYPEYAYDMYHYRDYSPDQVEPYLLQIQEELVDFYRVVNASDLWHTVYEPCSETDTFRYVKTAAQNMGGDIADAFSLLEEGGLYNIAYKENKQETSYVAYLWSYYEPYIFMKPYLDISDHMVFAHEFGHFVNNYVCWGNYAGTDVAEVHSQAMEYLSLCYTEHGQMLEVYKLADTLCTYVEQAAYALFEQQVYDLTGDDLTVENVQKLYEQIGREFGFDSCEWDIRDYVVVSHFYTSPMYIVSYVVSCDIAFQIYQLELAEPGAGLALYEKCIYSTDGYLMLFAESYGLEPPFAEGRLEEVKKTLETGLQNYI